MSPEWYEGEHIENAVVAWILLGLLALLGVVSILMRGGGC